LNAFQAGLGGILEKTFEITQCIEVAQNKKRSSFFIFSLYFGLLLAYQRAAEEAEYTSNSGFLLAISAAHEQKSFYPVCAQKG
jgi:diacylglycerol kinase family enzyme